jgi:hypothetical protein
MAAKADGEVGSRMPAKGITGYALSDRVKATLLTAEASGLTLGKKGKQLSGRVHQTLFEAAAAKSGLNGAELLDYALAKVALEDDFAERLIALKGSISRDVDLGA